jgi:hypothetical protein
VSHKSRTTTELAVEEPGAAATRGAGVDDANWLSQLLARASRDDEAEGAALVRSVARTAEEPPSKRVVATRCGLQEAERKAYATLISAKELQNKLSVVVQSDRKEGAAQKLPQTSPPNAPQHSWPNPDAALDLVKKAAEALRIMEQRAAALESYAIKVVKEAREELASAAAKASSYRERAVAAEEAARELRTQLSATEKRASSCEERARHAEEEVSHAKVWMAHVNGVITETLSSAVRDFGGKPAKGDAVNMIEIDSKLKNGRSRIN